jgi:hypothetical protein
VTVASRGRLQDASILPGFVAEDGGRPVGIATYRPIRHELEFELRLA